MALISVVICCANAEKTLPAAIASAAWADELVIVDSGSEDGTGPIARAAAGRYVVEPWRGYAGQKKFGAELARHDWVFILDGDEEISPALAQHIRGLTDAQLGGLDVVYVRRHNWVMGRYVRAWSPDWQSRLIHRGRVTWPEEVLHESRVPGDPSRTLKLSAHLEHKRTQGGDGADWADYFCGRRMDERLIPVAEQMYARGRRVRWWGLWFRPWAAFCKFYVFKGAFLDGAFGLLVAQKAAGSVQLKYAALWAVQQKRAATARK